MASPSRAADPSGTAKRSEISDPGGERHKEIHHGQTLAAWVGSLTAMVAVIVGGFRMPWSFRPTRITDVLSLRRIAAYTA